jgi:hypothetical protein
MAERTHGTMQVDWEQRADLDRLRRERLARAKSFLAESELGALLCFDMANIRYITATHIGTSAMDKLVRFCLLAQNDEPIMWDFGSAARHHNLYSPWLGEERSRAGISTLRGAVKGRAAEELLVAGGGHPTASGPLPGIREPQSNLNNAVVPSARFEGAGAPVD